VRSHRPERLSATPPPPPPAASAATPTRLPLLRRCHRPRLPQGQLDPPRDPRPHHRQAPRRRAPRQGILLACRGGGALRSAEQRWKWVENYCWRNGCLRSQNQCNDKWDNLLRDYKKVRGYESRVSTAAGASGELPSYWTMERHERKERNLPTNLALEVFEALTDVLTRRAARRANATTVPSRPPPPLPSPLGLGLPPANPLPPPPPPPPPLPLLHHHHRPHSHPFPMSNAISYDTSHAFHLAMQSSEMSESEENEGPATTTTTAEPDTKRRRLRRLGSSVVRSATLLARTMLACEEKREQRHRELVELQERRLRLEEERTEVRRQGFAGLISAVDNLSGAIHALVADRRSGDHR
ncbi:unnamed protein product, partial [Musa textilis]